MSLVCTCCYSRILIVSKLRASDPGAADWYPSTAKAIEMPSRGTVPKGATNFETLPAQSAYFLRVCALQVFVAIPSSRTSTFLSLHDDPLSLRPFVLAFVWSETCFGRDRSRHRRRLFLLSICNVGRLRPPVEQVSASQHARSLGESNPGPPRRSCQI